MAKIGRFLEDPDNPVAIADHLGRIRREFDGLIEFGHPYDPVPTVTGIPSVVLAGSSATAHQGTLQNIRGSWAERDIDTLDTAHLFHHNLDIPVLVAGEPNVRVFTAWIQHSGAAAVAASVISWNFEEGDAVNLNSIELRFYAEATRTVNAGNPIKVSFFFIPAVSRP